MLQQHTQQILTIIFGEEVSSPFNVVEFGTTKGKISLPLDVSIQSLIEANLPYINKIDIREEKIVVYYH